MPDKECDHKFKMQTHYSEQWKLSDNGQYISHEQINHLSPFVCKKCGIKLSVDDYQKYLLIHEKWFEKKIKTISIIISIVALIISIISIVLTTNNGKIN